MAERDTTLQELRAEIDRLDDALVDMLISRTRLVTKIGAVKGTDGGPIVRPGREAEILRRLLGRAAGAVEGAAIVRIWREIVSASVRQQGPFSVAASVPENGPSCWILARDQYGAATPISAAAGPAQVVAAVANGKASVGIVPFPASDEADSWWPSLMAGRAPRVIASLPAVEGLVPAPGCARGLAVALMPPEPSGDDRSLIGFETESGVGRSNLRDSLERAGFVVRSTWFQESIGAGNNDGFLAEVDGFVLEDGPAMTALRLGLGSGVARVAVIGAFAVPPRLAAKAEGGGAGEAAASGGSGS